MKFTWIALQTLDKIGIKQIPLLPARNTQIDNHFLHSKNIIISGEFFPTSESAFKENLLKSNVNVQPEITPETEILICGKYPDWILVEEASLYGIKIIFIDKAGELFSRIAIKLCKSSRPVLSYKEQLGV